MELRVAGINVITDVVDRHQCRGLVSVTFYNVGLAIARSPVRLPVSQVAIKWLVYTWMGDCLRTRKPSRYITKTKVNSAFHPSGVGKSSTGLHGGVKAGRVHL